MTGWPVLTGQGTIMLPPPRCPPSGARGGGASCPQHLPQPARKRYTYGMGDHEHLHADGTVHDHGTADLDHQHTGSGAVVWDQATGATPAPDFDVPPRRG